MNKTDVQIMQEVHNAAVGNTHKKLGKKKMKATEQLLRMGEDQRVVSWIWQGAGGELEEGKLFCSFYSSIYAAGI